MSLSALKQKTDHEVFSRFKAGEVVSDISRSLGISQRNVKNALKREVGRRIGAAPSWRTVLNEGSFPCEVCRGRQCQQHRGLIYKCPQIEAWARKVFPENAREIFNTEFIETVPATSLNEWKYS